MSSVDAVVVGGGTVGAWTACFLAEAGRSVVLVEAATLGCGASSRAAGMVRAQGGTEAAIRLGLYSRAFYAGQRDRYPLDSGFVAQGYLMPCFTDAEVTAAAGPDRAAALARPRRGVARRRRGRPARDRDGGRGHAVVRRSPPVTATSTRPATSSPTPPRSCALGVDVRERCAFTGLRVHDGRVVGVDTAAGFVEADAVVLTGGPDLAAVGAAAGGRIVAGGTRHQVVVTAPVPGVDPGTLPMVFDVASGIYWRPGEDGGLLWGMSNPDEAPGRAREFDWGYYEQMRARVATLFPATAGLGVRRAWAATIDYTPDHLPLLGPLLTDAGPVAGTVVAGAGGHGMMWGPGVARAAADLVLHGSTDVLDVTDLGLDRFDAEGRSRLAADPIALPFPHRTG